MRNPLAFLLVAVIAMPASSTVAQAQKSAVRKKQSAPETELLSAGKINVDPASLTQIALTSAELEQFDLINLPRQAPLPLKDLSSRAKIVVIYFIPKDREPTRNWSEKIQVLLTFVNDPFRDASLAIKGGDRAERGLDFEFHPQVPDRVLVHRVDGLKIASFYLGAKSEAGDQYARVQKELFSRMPTLRSKNVLILLETYVENEPAEFEWKGGIALGGKRLAMFSAWILRDEFCASTVPEQLALFQDSAPIKGRLALSYGRLDSPRYAFICDGFGAVAHELGHSIGSLAHDNHPHSIMTNGFRTIRWNFDPVWQKHPRVHFIPEHRLPLINSGYVH